ncbi:zinc finger and BTB domain-containing protein 41-like isoform X2 [Mya arenaria]|nr:zinc finger and BTB domain-containing protein 41-like isoform X2 [Mya arenaria]
MDHGQVIVVSSITPTEQENVSIDSRTFAQVFSRLKCFREVGKLCDVRIHVNGEESFLAHGAVLAAWSSRLAAEILDKLSNASRFDIELQCDKAALSQCLDYMYSGHITLSQQNVTKILTLAKVLSLDSLCLKCEQFLIQEIRIDNFIDKYFLALKFKLLNLQEKVAEFVHMNITLVIECVALLNLRPVELKVFITEGKMTNLKQEVKFSLIISWIGINLPERERFLLYLFNQICWNESVADLLMQISCTQNIFTTNELCLFQLLESFVTAKVRHLGPYETIYPRLSITYSRILIELKNPREFLVSADHILKMPSVFISSKVGEFNGSKKVETQDVAVNTEAMYSDENIIKNEILDISSERTECDTAVDIVVEKIGDGIASAEAIKSPNHKNRRKSLPRKLPANRKESEKTKEKKSKKSRKNQSKEGKNKSASKVQNTDIEVTDKLEEVNDEESALVNSEQLDDLEDDYDDYNDDTEDDMTFEINEKEAVINQSDVKADVIGAVSIFDKDAEDKELNEEPFNNDKPFTNVTSIHSGKGKRGRPTGTKGRPSGIKTRKRVKGGLKSLRESMMEREDWPRKQRARKPIDKSAPKIECSYEACAFMSRRQDMLEKHVERVHLTDAKLACHKCEFKTNDMKSLCEHMKHHYTDVPYNCEFGECSHSFMRIGVFIRHVMTHLDIRPYGCDLCPKKFVTYNQLCNHKKLHEGRKFECDVCNKTFSTKGAMQQHRMIHFSSKPYLCDTCGFATKHQSHLISHRKIHTGDVFRCTYPDCQYSTPKQGHMTQHLNSHYNIRNHICQVCGKSFVVRGKLLRHERIHLKDKLYKCKQCDYQTSRTDRMKLHIESHGIKFRRKKFNIPKVEEDELSEGIDYHQFYERIQQSDAKLLQQDSDTNVGSYTVSSIPFMTMTDLKVNDVISLAASTTILTDTFPSSRLPMDPLSAAAAAANIDGNAHGLDYSHSYERLQAASFDHL